MPSVEENKLKKRNKILESAYNLFAKNGINTTPIDEVVKCAGVAKGTFYLYFHDKYDLMDQIILYKSAAIIKSVIAQMKNINTDNKMEAIDQLTFFVDAIIDYMIENKEMLSVISEKSSILYSLIIDNGDDNIKLDFDYLTDIIVKLGNPPENNRFECHSFEISVHHRRNTTGNSSGRQKNVSLVNYYSKGEIR